MSSANATAGRALRRRTAPSDRSSKIDFRFYGAKLAILSAYAVRSSRKSPFLRISPCVERSLSSGGGCRCGSAPKPCPAGSCYPATTDRPLPTEEARCGTNTAAMVITGELARVTRKIIYTISQWSDNPPEVVSVTDNLTQVTAEDAGWLATHLQTMIATNPSAWATTDLTLSQLTALHFIRADEPLTLTRLAQALGTGPPATSAMVDRLARAGLVRRTLDPRDHRRIQLAVTSTAELMIRKVDTNTARRVQVVLHGMSPAARRHLTNSLKDTAQQLA